MFGLIAAALAMTIPATDSGTARKIESRVGDKIAESGLVGMWYAAFVDPDGTITGCKVRALIGDPDTAREVCRDVIGFHAKPAIGPDGTPTYGYALGSLNFADNYSRIPRNAIEPDVIITALGLDKDAERVDLTVQVGIDGAIETCEPADEASTLSRTACRQVKSVTMPVAEANGEPVAYLYPLIVEFRRGQG